MGMGLISYFLVVASDLTADRLRKKHPTKGQVLSARPLVWLTVETVPAAVMSQNGTNAYALHDQSLLLTMLVIQTNGCNGERIKIIAMS
jgi:hypothetical protein